MDLSLQQRIRERAYDIWSASGREHGQAEQHWLRAERQLLSEMAAQLSTTPSLAEQKKASAARQRRTLTNIQPQPKRTARAS
jgi:hypothetical protein